MEVLHNDAYIYQGSSEKQANKQKQTNKNNMWATIWISIDVLEEGYLLSA